MEVTVQVNLTYPKPRHEVSQSHDVHPSHMDDVSAHLFQKVIPIIFTTEPVCIILRFRIGAFLVVLVEKESQNVLNGEEDLPG